MFSVIENSVNLNAVFYLVKLIFGKYFCYFNANRVADLLQLHLQLDLIRVLVCSRVNSTFKYCLFKLARQLLDGRLPEFFHILLEPHISHHTYGTRGGRFRHPALVSEVERRFLPHQLISLYDSLPDELLTQNLTTSLRNFKSFLLNSQ